MAEENYVLLVTSTHPLLQSLIEDVLKDEGIPFEIRQEAWTTLILGAGNPIAFRRFFVPADRLQTAKEVLCANDIVCDVSERLLSRTLEEVVKPLLRQAPQDRDLERLAYLVEINNKETVRALYEAIEKETGGLQLLEDLFFHLARIGSPALRGLAKVLGAGMGTGQEPPRGGKGGRFGERLFREAQVHGNEVRVTLLDVLSELPAAPWRLEFLLEGLRSEDEEVRSAASEALFALKHGQDYDYDPEAPLEERQEAIEKLLESEGG